MCVCGELLGQGEPLSLESYFIALNKDSGTRVEGLWQLSTEQNMHSVMFYAGNK